MIIDVFQGFTHYIRIFMIAIYDLILQLSWRPNDTLFMLDVSDNN